MMRIAFDAKRLFFNLSGLGNYSRTLVKELSLLYDDDLMLCSPSIKSNERTAYFLGDRFKVYTSRAENKLSKSLWRNRKMAREAAQSGAQIFHGLSNELPADIRQTGMKSVVTIHDLIFMRYPQYYPLFDRVVYKHKVAAACRNADAIVAISKKTASDLVDLLGVDASSIHVIYQGCDEVFSQPIPEDIIKKVLQNRNIRRPYIISVGTLENRKNQLLLVEAFEASKLYHSHELLLVGKHTSYAHDIKEFLSGSACAGSVKLLNNVAFHELPALYRGAEFSVYPSKYEGFGLPVIESMAAGCPVIAASGSCLEEAGGEAALYIDPTEVNDLSESMLKLTNSDALRMEMKEKGLAQAAGFNQGQMAQNYHALYASLL